MAHTDAVAHLRRADPVLAAVMDRVGPCGLKVTARRSHFATLTRAIIGQQLSGTVAETIWRRLCSLGPVRPAEVAELDVPALRATGMSRAKAESIRELAAGARILRGLTGMDDEQVIARLVTVRGVGPWTAQMFLMFGLGRPDVWPSGDRGIRNAVRRLYPGADALEAVAEPWRPHRTVAAWYLWRSLEAVPV